MTTVDHFAVWKALSDPNGTWKPSKDWKVLEFPLALVVMGSVPTTGPEEEYQEDE